MSEREIEGLVSESFHENERVCVCVCEREREREREREKISVGECYRQIGVIGQ